MVGADGCSVRAHVEGEDHAAQDTSVETVVGYAPIVYEVRPRKDHRGVDLISDALPFGRLWYGEPNAISNAIGYAMHRSRSHDAVIRVYDKAGNVIQTHELSAFLLILMFFR